MKSQDEILLEKVRSEISQDSETALRILCLLLATPKKFKDNFEWCFCLGKLFSLMQEGQATLRESSRLLYDEAGDAIIDERIKRELEKFSVRERSGIAAFLIGASKPLTLDKIEAIAGKARQEK